MEFNNYELTMEQKCEGKWLLYRIILILAYVIYVILYLALIIKSTILIPLGALIPVTLWILIHFTYRYTTPAYKYTMISGALSFYVIYGRKSKLRFTTRISDAKRLGPVSNFVKNSGINCYSALPSRNTSDAYALHFSYEGCECVFLFVATPNTLKILKFYNPALFNS